MRRTRKQFPGRTGSDGQVWERKGTPRARSRRPGPPVWSLRAKGRLYFPVIRNRVVPQDEHLPLMAWRPFLKVTSFGEAISLLFFSLTQ